MNRRHRRVRRPALLYLLAGLLTLAACSPSENTGSKTVGDPLGAPATTTTLPDDAPTDTTAPPATTAPPEGTGLEPPTMPDPYDILSDALEPLAGFAGIDEEPSELLDTVGFRLSPVVDGWMRAVMWDSLEVGGEPVLVVAMYPYGELRADPFTPLGMAGIAAGADIEVEDATVDGATAWRFQLDDEWWYTWAGHSVAFLAVGDDEAVEAVLEPLVAADAEVYAWETGDCLYTAPDDGAQVPYAPFGDDIVVPCDGPHSHYVLATTTFDEAAGGIGDEEYLALQTLCGESFEEHVGLPSTESAVDLVIYAPDEDEWDRGDRYGACVIGRYAGGEPMLVEDTYRGMGEAARLDRTPGDCYGPFGIASQPVPCDQPHVYQYLGAADLPSSGEYPSGAGEQQAVAACDQLLAGQASTTESGDGRIETFAMAPPPHRWEQGERTVHCFAYPAPLDPDDTVPLIIVGPLQGEWRILPAEDVIDA